MKLPIEQILQQNSIALGKTGSGKSSAYRIFVEWMLDRDMPICIIDPKGDWWGLRLSGDGKKKGYPLVIFGGPHADVPINDRSGSDIAAIYSIGNRPCIIDVSEFTVGQRTRFFIDFAAGMFRFNQGRRHILIDEVHNFVPKGKIFDVDAGKCLHWGNRLASEGRGKGLTMMAASQRPQKVHNDFLTSCETLIAMRVLHASDRGAYKDWIDGCGDPAKGKEMLAQIANLKRGTGYVWSPEIEFGPEFVTFPMFKTFDSFSPQSAPVDVDSRSWDSVDLEEVKSKLAAVVKEAEDNDPKLLKMEIMNLHRQLEKRTELTVDKESLAKEYLRGNEEGYKVGHAAAIQAVRDLVHDQQRALAVTNDALIRLTTGPLPRADIREVMATAKPVGGHEFGTTAPRRTSLPPKEPIRTANKEFTTLPPGEKAVLIACSQYDGGCYREQLSILTGYKRSSRDAYIQRLKEKGFIEPVGTKIVATSPGVFALGHDYEPLPVGEDLRDYWFQRLPVGEKKILQIVCKVYPGSIARSNLDEPTGFKRSSRDAYLQRLKTRMLIEVDGSDVKASESLF